MDISEIQKYLIFSSMFFLGMGFIICFFISSSNTGVDKKSIKFIYYISLMGALFMTVFLLLFMNLDKEYVLNTFIDKKMAAVFILICAFVLLAFELKTLKIKASESLLAVLFASITAIIYSNPVIIILSFIVIDFACLIEMVDIKEWKSANFFQNKYLYFIALIFFAGTFILLNKEPKYARISMTAVVMFIIFLSTPVNLVFYKEFYSNLKNENTKHISKFITLCCATEALIVYKFTSLYPALLSAEALTPIISLILLFSALQTVKEEKYEKFICNDTINSLLMVLIFIILIKPDLNQLIVAIILMLIQGILFSSVTIESDDGVYDYKMSDIRYNIKRIKNGIWIIIGIITQLCLEIYIYAIFYFKLRTYTFISAIIMFTGALYTLNILNKLFIFLSMVHRTDFNLIWKALKSGITIKFAIFISLIAVLIAKVVS